MKKITIHAIEPNQDSLLAGRLDGKRFFLRVLEELPVLSEPTVLILDFKGIELATSSFLNEALPPLREHLRLGRPGGYVVLANLAEKVREELETLLSRMADAFLVVETTQAGAVTKAELVGALDQKLLDTLELVRSKGETTAVELHSDSTDSTIGATAWNNRLAALASKSLIVELPQGRSKKYRPVLEKA
jgi:hypothetical protein